MLNRKSQLTLIAGALLVAGCGNGLSDPGQQDPPPLAVSGSASPVASGSPSASTSASSPVSTSASGQGAGEAPNPTVESEPDNPFSLGQPPIMSSTRPDTLSRSKTSQCVSPKLDEALNEDLAVTDVQVVDDPDASPASSGASTSSPRSPTPTKPSAVEPSATASDTTAATSPTESTTPEATTESAHSDEDGTTDPQGFTPDDTACPAKRVLCTDYRFPAGRQAGCGVGVRWEPSSQVRRGMVLLEVTALCTDRNDKLCKRLPEDPPSDGREVTAELKVPLRAKPTGQPGRHSNQRAPSPRPPSAEPPSDVDPAPLQSSTSTPPGG